MDWLTGRFYAAAEHDILAISDANLSVCDASLTPTKKHNSDLNILLDVKLADRTVGLMNDNSTFPAHLLPTGYLDHFNVGEYKFRWHEATGLDPELHFRANHLASRLASLWITDGHVLTAKHVLARITNTSIRTMDRALIALEDRGWVQVNRDNDGLSIFLVIPQHGLHALLSDRRNSEQQRTLRLTRELATQELFATIAHQFGVEAKSVKFGPDWKIVRSRLRSIVRRMDVVDLDCRKLTESICESIPAKVDCPAALVSSRIDNHLRHYTHLSHRPTKSGRTSPPQGHGLDIQSVINVVSESLRNDFSSTVQSTELRDC